MIKDVRIVGNDVLLGCPSCPIISNIPFEEDLADSMTAAMERYPDAAAILLRRYGFYVWVCFVSVSPPL